MVKRDSGRLTEHHMAVQRARAELRATRDRTAQAALAADARLSNARELISRASSACLAGRIDAGLQVRRALDVVAAARAELRRIAEDDAR